MKDASKKYKLYQLVKYVGRNPRLKIGMVVEYNRAVLNRHTYTVVWFLPDGHTLKTAYLYEWEIAELC